MTFEEVRKILKEYYIEKQFVNGLAYGYKERGEYNHAFILKEVYAWELKEAEEVGIFGEQIKYGIVYKQIEDEVYDNADKLRIHIMQMKNRVKLLKSQIKIKKLEKDFK